MKETQHHKDLLVPGDDNLELQPAPYFGLSKAEEDNIHTKEAKARKVGAQEQLLSSIEEKIEEFWTRVQEYEIQPLKKQSIYIQNKSDYYLPLMAALERKGWRWADGTKPTTKKSMEQIDKKQRHQELRIRSNGRGEKIISIHNIYFTGDLTNLFTMQGKYIRETTYLQEQIGLSDEQLLEARLLYTHFRKAYNNMQEKTP